MMQTGNRYADRHNAGQSLAAHLVGKFGGRRDTVVLGLPRGGLPVAAEVARALCAPLDVFPVRKLGAPTQPEFAVGALGAGGVQVIDEGLVEDFQLSARELDELIGQQQAELEQQERFYRRQRPAVPLAGRIAIIVDDGAATGYTLVAACAGVRLKVPAQIVVAVPVGSIEACAQLEEIADDLVCPLQPAPFHAVGLWYVHFEPVSETEATRCLVSSLESRP